MQSESIHFIDLSVDLTTSIPAMLEILTEQNRFWHLKASKRRTLLAKRALAPFSVDHAVRGTAGMKAAEAVSRALSTNALTEVVSHVLLIGSHPGSDIIAMRLLFPMTKVLAISRIPARDEGFFKFCR